MREDPNAIIPAASCHIEDKVQYTLKWAANFSFVRTKLKHETFRTLHRLRGSVVRGESSQNRHSVGRRQPPLGAAAPGMCEHPPSFPLFLCMTQIEKDVSLMHRI